MNALDHYQWSPLFLAIARTSSIWKHIRQRHDTLASHVLPNGFSALHLAALTGKAEIIRHYVTVLPKGSLYTSYRGALSGHSPCALYIMALCGAKSADTDTQLLNDLIGQCPQPHQMNALYLMAAESTLTTGPSKNVDHCLELWARVFTIRAQTGHSEDDTSAELENFYHIKEPQTLNEVKELFKFFPQSESQAVNTSNPKKSHLTSPMVYFCLMIVERHLGPWSCFLYRILFREGFMLIKCGCFQEGAKVLSRALKLVETTFTNDEDFFVIFADFCANEMWFSSYLDALQQLPSRMLAPSLTKHLHFIVKVLKCSLQLPVCHHESLPLRTIFVIVLERFMFGLHLCRSASELRVSDRPTCLFCEGFFCQCKLTVCDELNSIGREFLTVALPFSEKVNIIELAIDLPSHFSAVSRRLARSSLEWLDDEVLLLETVMDWGAAPMINMINKEGLRPLHLAVMLASSSGPETGQRCKATIIQTLMRYGAHVDARVRIDALPVRARTAMELASPWIQTELFGDYTPLPLACLACNIVLKHCRNHNSLPLPQAVKRFINMHV